MNRSRSSLVFVLCAIYSLIAGLYPFEFSDRIPSFDHELPMGISQGRTCTHQGRWSKRFLAKHRIFRSLGCNLLHFHSIAEQTPRYSSSFSSIGRGDSQHRDRNMSDFFLQRCFCFRRAREHHWRDSRRVIVCFKWHRYSPRRVMHFDSSGAVSKLCCSRLLYSPQCPLSFR